MRTAARHWHRCRRAPGGTCAATACPYEDRTGADQTGGGSGLCGWNPRQLAGDDLEPAALEDAATFPLAAAAPDPVVDAVGEGVLEARLLDGAISADATCAFDPDSVA